MTAQPQPDSKSPSRRALLAGALGGIGAWAASAIGRASPVQAANGAIVHVGDELTGTSVTRLTNSANANTVIWGESTQGVGVVGTSDASYGVYGTSNSSIAVRGESNSGNGIWGTSASASQAAAVGRSFGDSTGVLGVSGAPPPAKAKTGVHGYANQDTNAVGVWGESGVGIGVRGVSGSNTALRGDNTSGFAVVGSSSTGVGVLGGGQTGVWGTSSSLTQPGTLGQSTGNGTGVEGVSGAGPAVPGAKPKTGVYGYAIQDSTSRGVMGETTSGHGVHGIATSGYAGYFVGKVYTTTFHEMTEMASPAAPSANKGRLFMRDNGSGKTQLCVRFSTGAVQVLATQP